MHCRGGARAAGKVHEALPRGDALVEERVLARKHARRRGGGEVFQGQHEAFLGLHLADC